MSPSSKRTVCSVRLVTNGFACVRTLPTVQFHGTLIERVASPKRRTSLLPHVLYLLVSVLIYSSCRKNLHVGDSRGAVFANDPYVRKFDSERVLCKVCEAWIPLGTENNMEAVQAWMRHKSACLQSKAPTTSSATPTSTYAPRLSHLYCY